jgi:uncharacterized membrane protein YqhA
MRWLERMFEAVLWNGRFAVLAGVFGSLVASVAMFYVATIDTVLMAAHLAGYASPRLAEGERRALHDATLRHVVEIIDGYLLAAVLLIFGFGLYELFVSRIDPARRSEAGASVLRVRDLDDLKNRLGKVVLMILVVTFFERVVVVPISSATDLLALAAGIALAAAALWLAHASEEKRHRADTGAPAPPVQ